MTPIKLTEKNKPKIESAIHDTISRRFSVAEIYDWGTTAEKKLNSLGILKKNRIDSIVNIPYGDCIPNSYKWSAEEQRITLERRPTGWFLINVSRSKVPMRSHGIGGDQAKYAITRPAHKDLMKTLSISLWVPGHGPWLNRS